MNRILANLTALNFAALLAAFLVGWLSFFRGSRHNPDDSTYILHIYLGLIAGTTTLGVHCLVFIYFLGTGRWVKEVAQAYKLPDEPYPKLTRELKRKAFPYALFAMLVPIAASAAGAGVATLSWPWYVHALLGTFAIILNIWAFVVEYDCVVRNAQVIDGVMVEVDRIRAAHGLPSNEEALRQEQQQSG